MSTLTTIQSTDLITSSRANINDNFAALNAEKLETSVLDTDTTLAADSDAKVATQKAVKAYVDGAGVANASTTVRGLVEEATDAQVGAGTDTGETGARLFVPPSKLNTQIDAKIAAAGVNYASGATSHDISSATSTTIAHGLGTAPTYVKVSSAFSAASNFSWTEATYVDGTQSAIYSTLEVGTAASSGSGFRIYEDSSAPRYITGTITIDATNITIAWSKTSTPTGTAPLLWVAQK